MDILDIFSLVTTEGNQSKEALQARCARAELDLVIQNDPENALFHVIESDPSIKTSTLKTILGKKARK